MGAEGITEGKDQQLQDWGVALASEVLAVQARGPASVTFGYFPVAMTKHHDPGNL